MPDWVSDPTFILVASTIAKIVFVLGIIFTFAPVMVWAERRQSAMMQDRVGPVRAGLQLPAKLLFIREPLKLGALLVAVIALAVGAILFLMALGGAQPWWYVVLALGIGAAHAGIWVIFDRLFPPDGNITLFGLLHPAADALKMIWKEDFVPPRADKFLHAVAPIISMVPSIAVFAVIPFADPLHLDWITETIHPDRVRPEMLAEGTTIPMQIASINVGILYIFAIAGTGVVGAAIAGYASDNKYSLLGGLRAAGQMVSYEVTLGLSLVGCFMVYDTLLLDQMVQYQIEQDLIWRIPRYGIFVQPLAFFLFFAASTAESKRIPFDVPEGESEIVGGYFTEYSGMKFGMFMTGEFIEVIASSALIVTIFLGGWHVPFLGSGGFDFFGYQLILPHGVVILFQVMAFILKLVVMIWLNFMVRWSLPRFRYDQIMKLCWQYLLPLSLLNILGTGVLILIFGDR